MKSIIITGTTSGLGSSLLTDLLSENVKILALNRQPNIQFEESYSIATLGMATCDLAKLSLDNFVFPPSTFENVSEVVFVMNAATIQPLVHIASLTLADLKLAFDVNYFSYVILTKILLQKCKENNLMLRIIFVSTGSINRAISGWSAYSASKGALLSFCKHVDLENRNVKFETFDPGIFKSNIQDQISIFSSGADGNQLQPDFNDVSEISNKLKALILLDGQ
jgi:NAD(P)-dependent dehydrogenase (short-subunit alcohol dehydrogenase family)